MDVIPNMSLSKGAWTSEEDRKLSEVIAVHGAKKWKTVANKAGLNRCGKSCRLRWLNYLRPNIKRGNISDQEEDLIVRLHKLLGNRWSLIAGRLPGRTDNEIKNYWNSHLRKKIKQKENQSESSTKEESRSQTEIVAMKEKEIPIERSEENSTESSENQKFNFFADDDFFNFMEEEGPLNLKWVSEFLEVD